MKPTPRAFPFEPLDRSAQPVLDYVLHLCLALPPLEQVHRFPQFIERNVMARHISCPLLWRNEINQHTLAARAASCDIAEVEATGRILKNCSRLPGRLDRTAVAALFEAMGGIGQLPPVLAAWSPDLIFFFLGLYFFFKMPT